MEDDIYNPDHNPVRYVAEFFGELSHDAINTSNIKPTVVGSDAWKLIFALITC